MERFSDSYIDSYEKKISVRQIYLMYQEKKIVFPEAPLIKKSTGIERVSGIVEIILLGFALPAIYVSERQDGSLLVLNSDDGLRCLISFLDGYYPVRGLEFYPELEGYGIRQLESEFPRRTSWLYDYRFSFQIIEYTTPRYMHIQMGNYIERWNFTREQGVRNELYGKDLEERLRFLEQEGGQSAAFFSKVSLNRQYMVLRILMYCFVRMGDVQGGQRENLTFQQLLDRTAALILKKDGQWIEETAGALRKTTEELLKWCCRIDGHFYLEKEKGKERQAKALGYLYNVVWMCWEQGREVQRGLEQVVSDRILWRKIENEKVNTINIRLHFDMIEERLR